MPKTGTISISSLRKLAGGIFILVLVAIFLSLYFLEYIPSRQNEFHHSAFLELKQVELSLQERNSAYITAIQNFLGPPPAGGIKYKGVDSIDLSTLTKYFHYKDYNKLKNPHPVPRLNGHDTYSIGKISIEQDSLTRSWQIYYKIYNKENKLVAALSKSMDELVTNLVTTYKDIFDDYLIISDKHIDQQNDSPGNSGKPGPVATDRLHDGEIIYNSGTLSIDYLVNTDSLLKKHDGFSLINVHDVTIEGNPYKLLLYPFALGKERVILAGLISLDHYNSAFKKIPFNLIAMTGVLILLILINLPILKIFVLGRYERISDMDIRFIIGTYFIASFVGFFLFSNSFLNHKSHIKAHVNLKTISDEIERNFISEIDSICRQLKEFDSCFYSKIDSPGIPLQRAFQNEDPHHPEYFEKDSGIIHSIFKPYTYPYLDNIFWIDATGKWVARWGFKKYYNKTPLINVADRPYFSDFINKQYLTLPTASHYQFTIQPTLSRLDGEYKITIVKKSDSSKAGVFKNNWKNSSPPFLVGTGAEMNFVCNTVLPPGYSFSIINEDGEVLFDSKPGRALLSNISKDVDNPWDLLQCARYRNERYFKSMVLRGHEMALFVRPIKDFPYTLLTYYKVSQTEDVHEHLIGLSAFLTGFILLLLIFSALVNQWTRRRHALLLSHHLNFEWLQPEKTKTEYYRHLITWMIALLIGYLIFWNLTEWFFPESEFSLFFITLLFPFYVAIHYYLIRENYYAVRETKNENQGPVALPSLPLSALLIVFLLIGNCYAFTTDCNVWLVLAAQFFLILTIRISLYKLLKKKPKETKHKEISDPGKFLHTYSMAILIGVCLISIVPAMGIFSLLLRQETSLESNSTQLEMARMINLRRIGYNQRHKDFNFSTNDFFYTDSAFYKLKFQYGIYTFTGQTYETVADKPEPPGIDAHSISPVYIRLHQMFFPEGYIAARSNSPESANDSSWFFKKDNDPNYKLPRSQLKYKKSFDGINRDIVWKSVDSASYLNATQLLMKDINTTGAFYKMFYSGSLLCVLFLIFLLSKSLARRIFLLDLYDFKNCKYELSEWVDDLIPANADYNKLKTELNAHGNRLFKDEDKITMDDIIFYEKHLRPDCAEMRILSVGKLMENVYWRVWVSLSAREKFIVYDFAIDGFANYKNGNILHDMIQKKIFLFHDYRLGLMSLSFREFVLRKNNDPDIVSYLGIASKKDSWEQFKIPLLLILSLIGLFIFITQDMIFQKITGLLTTVTTLLPLLTTIFSKANGNGKAEGKQE